MPSTPRSATGFVAAGRRAASRTGPAARCRSWSTRARTTRVDVICGQGVAPAARDDRRLSPARPRSRARHRAARGRRARRLRRLDAAAARPRHDAAVARCWSRRSAMPRTAHPLRAAASARRSKRSRDLFETEWPTSAAIYLPGGGSRWPASCSAIPPLAETYQRSCARRKSAGRSREARDRGGPRRLVRRLRRRGDRPLLPHARR